MSLFAITFRDPEVLAKLDELIELMRESLAQGETVMADTAATLAALAAANASLDGIKSDIQGLKDLIAAGGTPQEVADAVNALADRLAQTDAETP